MQGRVERLTGTVAVIWIKMNTCSSSVRVVEKTNNEKADN